MEIKGEGKGNGYGYGQSQSQSQSQSHGHSHNDGSSSNICGYCLSFSNSIGIGIGIGMDNNVKAMVIAWAIAEPLRAPRAAFDLPSPLQRRPGGGSARRVAGMDAGQFGVRAGCPVDKPRSPDANLPGQRPGRRGSGVAFLLVTSLWPRKEK